MEVNNKMKHTIKVAWAKGFSQFLALAGAILLEMCIRDRVHVIILTAGAQQIILLKHHDK